MIKPNKMKILKVLLKTKQEDWTFNRFKAAHKSGAVIWLANGFMFANFVDSENCSLEILSVLERFIVYHHLKKLRQADAVDRRNQMIAKLQGIVY